MLTRFAAAPIASGVRVSPAARRAEPNTSESVSGTMPGVAQSRYSPPAAVTCGATRSPRSSPGGRRGAGGRRRPPGARARRGAPPSGRASPPRGAPPSKLAIDTPGAIFYEAPRGRRTMALLRPVDAPRELHGRRKLDVFNPATLERLGEVEMATPDDVRRAVARAREVQAAWAERSFDERGRFLLRARDLLVDR